MATVVVLSFYLQIREPVHPAYAAAEGGIRSGCVCLKANAHGAIIIVRRADRRVKLA